MSGTIFRTKNIETKHCPTWRWQFEHSNLVLDNLELTFVIKGSTKRNSRRKSAATTAEGFFFPAHKGHGYIHPSALQPLMAASCTVPECIAGAAHRTKHGTGQSILRAQPRLAPFFSPYSLLKRAQLIFN